MCGVDQSRLTWSADHFQIRQESYCSVKEFIYGFRTSYISHPALWAGGGGRGEREKEAAKSPESNKSDLLVMICIFYQKWRLARPCCYSPGSFVRRQKVSDSIWHSDTARGRVLSGEAGADHQWSHQNLDLLPILTAASDGWSVESFVQTSEWVLSDHEILRCLVGYVIVRQTAYA